MPPLRPSTVACILLAAACRGPGDGQQRPTRDTFAGDGPQGTGGGAGRDSGGHGAGGASGGGDASGGTGGGGDLPLDGFGVLSGDCDVIDTELTDPGPSLFVNRLDFGAAPFDYDALSAGGQAVYDAGNLGGSSLYSEVFAYEVLHRCEEAALLETEAGIIYSDPAGKKTDLLVALDGQTIGVSVTRAYAWPPEAPYTVEQAFALLGDKLADVVLSSANVGSQHAWSKQILSVIAYTPEHAASVKTAWEGLDAQTRADTIVLVTITDGDDSLLY